MIEYLQIPLPGWLVVGIATGFGPCMGHQFLIVLPYLTLTKRGPKGSFKEVLGFSLVRILTYALLGAGSGAMGLAFKEFVTGPALIGGARLVLGFFLLVISIFFLLWEENPFCRLLHKKEGRGMALAGFFTALTPCPALMGLLAFSAAEGSPFTGAVAGAAFSVGTSLSPLLLAGPLLGFFQRWASKKRILQIVRVVGGLILFGYGWRLLLQFFL